MKRLLTLSFVHFEQVLETTEPLELARLVREIARVVRGVGARVRAPEEQLVVQRVRTAECAACRVLEGFI